MALRGTACGTGRRSYYPSDGNSWERTTLGEQIRSHLGNLALEGPVGHPSGDFEQAGGHAGPEFRCRLWAGHKQRDIICTSGEAEAITWTRSRGRKSLTVKERGTSLRGGTKGQPEKQKENQD